MHRGKLNPRVFAFTIPAGVGSPNTGFVAADGGTVNTMVAAAGDTAGGGTLKGQMLTIVSGTGCGQTRRIIANSGGASQTITVTPAWEPDQIPDSTSTYMHSVALVSQPQNMLVGAGPTDTTFVIQDQQGCLQIDDIYNALDVTVVKGTGRGTRRIYDFTGVTRTFSIGQKWDVNPVQGDLVQVQGHLYHPIHSIHVRSLTAADSAIALRPGGLYAPTRVGLTAAAGVLFPPAEDPSEKANIQYMELAGAVALLIQRWE